MVISHFASRSLLAALHGLETAVVTSYQAPEGRQIQHGKDSKNPAANPNLVFVLLEFPSWVGKIMQNSRELHLKKTNVGCRFHRGVTCRPLFFVLHLGFSLHCQLQNRNPIREIHTYFLMEIWDGAQPMILELGG